MTTHVITTQIVDEMRDLPLEERQQILAFVRSLAAQRKGVKGTTLLRFANTIASDQLSQMQRAIKEDCEHIDTDEW